MRKIYEFADRIAEIENKKTKVINALDASKIYLSDLNENENYVIIIRKDYLKDYTDNYHTASNRYGDFKWEKIGNAILFEANTSQMVNKCNETVIEDIMDDYKPFINEIYEEDFFKDAEYKIFLKQMKLLATASIEENRNRLNVRMRELHERKREYTGELIRISKQLDEIRANMAHDKAIEEINEKVVNEFEKIRRHKLVNSIYIDAEKISISLNDIYMTEHYTKRKYYLGKPTIQVEINNYGIKIFNNNIRYNLWAGGAHPHVNENGSPCMGTAEEQFVSFWSEKEYYAGFITMLNYLQCADIDDCAGYYICEWDEVDADGNVIREGHRPTKDEYDSYGDTNEGVEEAEICHCCGEPIRNSVFVCADCGEYICENCATQINNDEFICDDCLADHWHKCSNCETWVKEGDDAVYSIELGVWLCDSCWEEEKENV